MSREVLLVGSVPLQPAATVFETTTKWLGSSLRRVPDGEQSGWIQAAWRSFTANNCLEESRRVKLHGRAASGVAIYKPREGVKVSDLRLGPYGYAANAAASYRVLRELREDGMIPQGLRFQVTMPGPGTSAYVLDLPAGQLLPLAREALLREVEEILDVIPPEDLTLQFDIAMEAEHEEYRRRPEAFDTPIHQVFSWSQQEMAESVAWLVNQVPEEVEVGFHICSIWHHWPDSGQDNEVLVSTANALADRITRPVGYLHLPIIPEHDHQTDYAPLAELSLQPETRLFLGLINLADGVEGARKRMELAAEVVPDFGVAFWCGLGGSYSAGGPRQSNPYLQRPTSETIEPALDLHIRVAEL